MVVLIDEHVLHSDLPMKYFVVMQMLCGIDETQQNFPH